VHFTKAFSVTRHSSCYSIITEDKNLCNTPNETEATFVVVRYI